MPIEIYWGIWKPVLYSINAILSVTVLFLVVLLKFQRGFNIPNLTINLISFLKFSIPFMLIIPLGSIFMFAHFFIFGNESGTWHLCVRILMTFSSYTVRTTYLMVCVERLMATIMLQKYESYTRKKIGKIMVIIMLAISILCTVPVFFGEKFFIYSIHFVFFTHILTFILCIALIQKNRQLNKNLTFNPLLDRRIQIIENIKVLNAAKPHIYLITFFAPLGPIITLLISTLTNAASPLPIIYSFYNICLVSSLIILNRNAYLKNKRKYSYINPEIDGRKTLTVKNVLGHSMPAEINIEGHFAELKKMWI